MTELGKGLPIDTDQRLERGLHILFLKKRWDRYVNFLSKIIKLKRKLPANVKQELRVGLKDYYQQTLCPNHILFLFEMINLKMISDKQLLKCLDIFAQKKILERLY